jgi:prepilin-type N-terminal cleavage/methylation domain-containing protein
MLFVKSSSGYSLVELLVSMVIALIVMGGIYLASTSQESSMNIQDRLTKKDIDFKTLLKGDLFEREITTQIFQIAGITHILKERVESMTKKESIPYLETTAYLDIFLQNFESSYKKYNRLIDNYGIKDSNTLFYASISAIGATHHANAIALLELSKLTDRSNYESRYALGLLYQEAKNLEGASIEYQKIGDIEFKSNYFTFKLK